MSMNLNAETKNTVIKLWQTPTHISYMILPPDLGEFHVKGKKATEALYRYIEYVNGTIAGVFIGSEEELLERKMNVINHVNYIRQFLNDKTLEVWVE